MPTQISKSALLLKNTYELYAKMLAVENIRVVFDEAIKAPASFDILNRVLYISPIHAAQSHLIPGLIIHEVGHALFSVLSEEESKKLKRITKLLNIIDDGYQERMMCKKYPNSKKRLFTIFDEFFLKNPGASYANPKKIIAIVNILNFNCKGFKHGHYKQYPSYVLPEDIKLLKEAELINVPSLIERDEFSKVLATALKKYGEMDDDGEDIDKSKKNKKKDKSEKADGDADCEPSEESSDDDDDSEDGPNGGDKAGSEDDEDKKNNGKKPSNQGSAEDEVENILNEHKDELNDHHDKFEHKMGGETSYEVPTGNELIDISNIKDIYEKGCSIETVLDLPENRETAEYFKLCITEAKKVANKIFTQFNMRVQASNLANVQYKNSGMLDPERAALYQVYDDVFIKNAIEPNQQNHAYSVVLDWSSSMSSSAFALTLRIIELVYFAKSAGIEIEVWLYTSGYTKLKLDGIVKNICSVSSSFYKILNTKNNNAMELEHRIKAFWLLANEIQGPKLQSTDGYLKKFGMHGTNILEGLLLGHHVLSKMDADKKSCFILTDGEDMSRFEYYYNAKTLSNENHSDSVYVGGMNVNTLYNSNNETRTNATKAIRDMYKTIGQRTVGIAWNCSGTGMDQYCDKVIKAMSIKAMSRQATPGRGSNTVHDYIHADNLFINEIVKNLI